MADTSSKTSRRTGLASLALPDRSGLAKQVKPQDEHCYGELVQSANSIILKLDASGQITFVNTYAQKFFGYSENELIGRSALETIMPHRESSGRDLKDLLEKVCSCPQEIQFGENENLTKDGRRVWISWTNKAIQSSDGQPVGIVSVGHDITERKKAEQKLGESEERYRSLIENAPIGIYRTTPDGRIVDANSSLVKMLGYSSFQELAKRNIKKEGYEPGYSRRNFCEQIERDGEIIGLEVTWRTRTGSSLFVRENAKAIRDEYGKVLFYEGTVEDITQRKRAEKALLLAEEKYRGIFDNAAEGIFQSTLDGRYLTVNPMLAFILGYESPEELLSEVADINVKFYVAPQRRQEFASKVLEHGAISGLESRAYRKDKSIIWVSENARVIHDSEEQVCGFEGTVVDITERKQAEEALQYRVEFEKLITHISTHFINLQSTEIDKGINHALRAVGTFADVDRSYLFLFSEDDRTMSNTHEWCAEGIESQVHRLRNIPVERVPYFSEIIRRLEPFYIPRVADLPPEASAEKKEFEFESIQSLICIPMVYAGALMGFLGLDSVSTERTWSEDNISLLKIVGEIFVNALARKRDEESLRYRIDFEKLTSHLSTEFINLPIDRIDSGINYTLQRVGEFVGADRSYVVLISEDGATLSTTHEWCFEGIEPQIDRFQGVSLENFPWAKELLLNHHDLHIPKVEDLPPEAEREKDWFLQEGTQSLLCVPMFLGAKPVGLVGFDAVRSGRSWTEDVISLLRILSEILVNVLARKRTEESLRASEGKFRNLAENIPGVVYLCKNDRRCTMLYLNDAITTLTGYDKQEFLEDRVSLVDLYHPDDAADVSQQVGEAISLKIPFKVTYRIRHRSGKWRWVEEIGVGVFQDDVLLYLEGFVSDITERKQAETALQRTTDTLNSILTSSTEYAIAATDLDLRIIEFNPAAEEMFGYLAEDVLGKTVREIHESRLVNRQRFENAIQDVLQENKWEDDVVIHNHDGSRRFIHVVATPMRDEVDQRIGFVIFAHDNTEQKLSQQALRESELRYRNLFEGASDAIFVYDDQGRILDANQRACQIFGYSREELLRLKVGGRLSAPDPALERRAQGLLQRALAGETLSFEWKGQRKDGTVFPEEVSLKPITISGQKFLLSIDRDVTERKKAEEEKERLQAQLFQAQKMESIGLLAGGIAHDFNNLLAGILGFSSMAADELGPTHPATKSLNLIMQSSEKAAKLTRELLAYARGGPRIREVFDLNRLVKDLLNLLRINIPQNVSIYNDLYAESLMVHADPSQIQQVIMNLCINAGEAIGSQPGNISISTSRQRLFPADCMHAAKEGQDFVILEVFDSGSGLTEKLKSKIFEPFFSTKQFGRGMGLAAVQGIVDNHKGCILLDSTPGEGTSFKVCLPTSNRKAPQLSSASKPVAQGTETVLVVDDEATVLKVAQMVLTKLGYSVMTASNGEQALDCFDQHAASIDLVLLDLMLPDMNGEEVLSELQDRKADVHVLLSSGYSESMVSEKIHDVKSLGFIQKPYTAQTLGRAVRKALDRS